MYGILHVWLYTCKTSNSNACKCWHTECASVHHVYCWLRSIRTYAQNTFSLHTSRPGVATVLVVRLTGLLMKLLLSENITIFKLEKYVDMHDKFPIYSWTTIVYVWSITISVFMINKKVKQGINYLQRNHARCIGFTFGFVDLIGEKKCPWDCVPLFTCLQTYSWWRHQMEIFSAGNSPVTGEFPSQRAATRSFDVFFDLSLNERLNKQSWGWWFDTPTRPLWRHCNVTSPSMAGGDYWHLIKLSLNLGRLKKQYSFFCKFETRPFNPEAKKCWYLIW